MTPTLIAQEPNMPTHRLNDFTHRVWNLTAYRSCIDRAANALI